MVWFSKKAPPQVFTLTLTDLGRSLPVQPGQTLLDAALDADVPFPNLCRVGSCGTCKCRLSRGSTSSLVDLSYVLSPEEIRGGCILACQAVPSSDCEVSVASADCRDDFEEPGGLLLGRTPQRA